MRAMPSNFVSLFGVCNRPLRMARQEEILLVVAVVEEALGIVSYLEGARHVPLPLRRSDAVCWRLFLRL